MQQFVALGSAAPIGGEGWRVVALSSVGVVEGLAVNARARLPIENLNHDIEWLEAGLQQGVSIVVAAKGAGETLEGIMPIRVLRGSIDYTAGDIRLLSVGVREFLLGPGPLTAVAGDPAVLSGAMECLAEMLPADGAVYASAVPCDGAFYALLNEKGGDVAKRFYVFKWGGPSLHCKIDWTGSVDAYLARLGSEARRNFRRYTKKAFSDEALQTRVERFSSVADLERFFDDGIRVSDKTYQKNTLDQGLSRGGEVERRIRFAAERQAFLGHILYLRDVPVAFRYGFIYGDIFFAMQTGFDPAFASHRPGTVLLMSFLKDLEQRRVPIKVIDFLPFVTELKLLSTTRKDRVQNFYLFKRSMRGLMLYMALRALDMMVKALKRLSPAGRKAGRAGG
jgi:Acetyltransferase (GNAT) domain